MKNWNVLLAFINYDTNHDAENINAYSAVLLKIEKHDFFDKKSH